MSRRFPVHPSLSSLSDGRSRNESGLTPTTEEDLIEHQNDQDIDVLAKKLSTIHKIAKQIQDSILTSNQDIDNLDADMNGSRLSLSGATKQLKELFTIGANSHMCQLVLFIFGLFVLLFFLVKIYRWIH